jgi:hypothetical protein
MDEKHDMEVSQLLRVRKMAELLKSGVNTSKSMGALRRVARQPLVLPPVEVKTAPSAPVRNGAANGTASSSAAAASPMKPRPKQRQITQVWHRGENAPPGPCTSCGSPAHWATDVRKGEDGMWRFICPKTIGTVTKELEDTMVHHNCGCK